MTARNGRLSRKLLIGAIALVALAGALLVVFWSRGTIWATHGPQVTLEIDIERDITINGIDASDFSDSAVATGDINDDGSMDLIIGAFFAAPGGRVDAGETYVVFGPLATSTIQLSEDADITVNGVDPFDNSGIAVAAGDLNNDGAADLVIGASNADPPGGGTNAGETYVLFGPLSAGTLELATDADVVLNGVAESDLSGIDVAGGDVNDDGVMDLIIGASNADPGRRDLAGETYVVFGPLTAPTIELATSSNITIHGIDTGDHSGIGVSSGDINDDGADDVIIGAWTAAPAGRADAGETYVLFGPLATGTLQLSTAADVVVNGIDPSDFSGRVTSGDLNNDSAMDVVIGAYNADPGGRADGGETYVLFGPLSTGTLELSSAADLVLNGIDPNDSSGIGVGIGDLNDDGALDFIIGAVQADPSGRSDAGQTYVMFGEPTPAPPPAPPLPPPVPEPVPIPSLTQWGLVAMAVLVAALLLLRSRRTTTRGRT